jgi:hypothetical protein
MAIGAYATLAAAKLRLTEAGVTDTSNDTLITELCGDVNSWIESRCQRVLAPIPPFGSALAASVSSGALSVSLTDVTGLNIGDDLLIGLVSGTHESAGVMQIGESPLAPYTTYATETDYALGDRVAPGNGHIYQNTGDDGTSGVSAPAFPTNGSTVADGPDIVWHDLGADSFPVRLSNALLNAYGAATVCQTIYVQDGFDALEDGRLFVMSKGVVMLGALETSPYSGGPWAIVAQQDYYLRPSGPDLDPGWPYTEVWMTNIPTGSAYPVFYPGFGNIRFIGPGPCTGTTLVPGFGWPAIEDTISDIALKCVVVGFRGRTTGGTDTQTINVNGSRTFEAALSYTDRMTLDRHRVKSVLAG